MTEESKQEQGWEKIALEKLAFHALNEQKRARRWGILFKVLTFLYLAWVLILFSPSDLKRGPDLSASHTAVVKISDIIMDDKAASAETVIKGLQAAFEDKKTKGILLTINSPGGSPVQAGYIYDEIYRLRKKYPNTKIYAIAGDLCTSAAYYIASAADQIYADKASLIGSIGVLMNGFGFTGAMSKLGIERRLFTAGEKKGLLDPFSPLKQDDIKFIHTLLETVHKQFITSVKKGRGSRLKEDPDLFSGLFWTGEQALALGLIDGLGSPESVARDVIKEETVRDFTVEESFADRFAKKFGSFVGHSITNTLHFMQAAY